MYFGSENKNYYGPRMYETKSYEKYFHAGSQNFSAEPPADYHDQIKNNEDNLSLDSEGKQKSFIRLCERFAEKTSMQGLPYINAAKLWYAKVLWVIILLAGVAGMTLHLYYLIDQFLEYDVQVSISLEFQNLAFPAVTICNVNAVRKTKLYKTSQQLQSLVAQTDPSKIPPPGRRKKRNVDDFDIDFDNLTKSYDFSNRGGEKDQTFQITDTFKKLYMEENGSTRRVIGHQLNDMLLQCSFGGYQCYISNFTLVQTEDYGNCYTIQSTDLVVTNPGPDHDLSLILYTETAEYLTGINQGFGARILVHDTDTYPFPTDLGMYISSSFETHIGLKQVQVIRKGGLYGDCKDVSSFKKEYGVTYTRQLCQFFCKQAPIIKTCKCYDHTIADVYHTLNTTQTVLPCRTDSERQCSAQIKARQMVSEPDCPECTNPCQEIQYAKSSSSRNWPTDEYANVLMSGMCEKIPGKCIKIREYYLNGDTQGLAKNFIKLVIYFEDLNYELIEEEPEIEVQQFASDVGGAVGLWIGLSLISIFEVFQLLLECCAFGVHKCRQPKNKKSKDKYKENQNRM